MLNSFRQFREKIREINRRYSKPHIEMSPAVKISLIALRVYLLLLVGLMVYKFILMLS
jgi:hypothetical protein